MACPTLQNDRSLERPEIWKRYFLKTNGMFYFAERQDVSVQRPETWKRHFLKTHVMFYFAERQEPQAFRKMETPFSEDQWHVLLCRKTGRNLERPEKWKRHFPKRNGMLDFAK